MSDSEHEERTWISCAELRLLRAEVKRLTAERDALRGLEEGTHYRCVGCDEIYEMPSAAIIPIRDGHTARLCPECRRDGEG